MKKLRLINRTLLIIALQALISNCSQKEDALPVLTSEIQTVEQLKTELAETVNENILIQETSHLIINGIDYINIQLETNDSIFFKTRLINAIIEEPKKWNVNFEFTDNTDENYGFVGDSLYIKSIDLNPHSLAPLSASVSLEMPVQGRFEIEVLGKGENGITINHLFNKFDYQHELPILGLYNNFKNQVRISFLSEQGIFRHSEIHSIQTEEIESTLSLNILENNLPSDAQNIYFASNQSAGFDQTGEVRWIFSGNTFHLFRKLANGNLLITSRDDLERYHPKTFYEVTMLGEIIQEYIVPNYLHHDIRELPNGNFLVASNSSPIVFGDENEEEDTIIEIDRATGAILKTWDFNSILDSERTPIPNSRIGDWLHLNAFYFDDDDESIVISGRNQSAIAKIDYHTSEVKWIMSNHVGWSEHLEDKLLNPIGGDGNPIDPTTLDFWLAGQHAPVKLSNGNIVVYDNGYYRNFYYDSMAQEKSYTRVVEFSVSENNMTVELVSSFTYKDINTTNTGDVDYIDDTGGLLIGFMNGRSNTNLAEAPKILELDANKNIMFEVDVNVGAQYYRAERLFLYNGL